MAAGSYEEGWSQIDEGEQAMAADGGSRIERSGWRFGRFLKQANRNVVSFWGGSGKEELGLQVEEVTVVCEVGGMDRWLLGKKIRTSDLRREDNF